MIRRWCTIVAALAAASAQIGLAVAGEDQQFKTTPANTVSQDVDSLLRLQDEAAAGRFAAVTSQKALLPSIGKDLTSASEAPEWRLTALAAVYVLSGGNPGFSDKLHDAAFASAQERRLLQGTVHFMRGNPQAARAMLGNLNTSTMPARLAGRVALAQALLAEDSAREERFTFAIAAMPGTLIEESALRRSILAIAATQDQRGFQRRLDRYVRRFPESVYAPVFWQELMTTIVNRPQKWPGYDIHQLDVVMARLPMDTRRLVYVVLARRAAAAGQPALAADAGRRVTRLSLDGSVEQQLGRFYSALLDIVSPEGEQAMRNLAAAPLSSMDASERALLTAAQTLGRQIARPPSLPDVSTDQPREATSIENRGSLLLEQSDKLMAELRR